MKSKTKNITETNTRPSNQFLNNRGEGTFFSNDKQVVHPFFTPNNIQAKLAFGEQGDKYEQEADIMAEEVVNNQDVSNLTSVIQNKCDYCKKGEKLQKKVKGEMNASEKTILKSNDRINNGLIQGKGIKEVDSSIETDIKNSKGRGQILDAKTKQKMENGFGADFTNVRVHTDKNAIQMNQDLGAQAFTNRSDIYFNKGKYNPKTNSGDKLLAHELTHVLQQGATVQKKIQLSAVDETVEDDTVYYVAVNDATIRKNQAPHKTSSLGNIPVGTRVKRIMRYKGDKYAKVQQLDVAEGETWWTTFTNIKPSETIANSGTFTAFYADIPIMNGPGDKTGDSGNKLTQNAKFTYDVKCNAYVKVTPLEGENSLFGWVYEKALFSAGDMTRSSKIIAYRTWLKARFTEAETKSSTAKIDFVNGILSQLETISNNINQDPAVYPNLETQNKNPIYSAETSTDLNTFVPHELIAITRKFIGIIEQVQTGATECTDQVVGGSLYSKIDWNSRLGVPQYRSQSDNLLSPEASCAPTSFAMGAERIGISRSDIVKAIDEKVASGETDEAIIKTKWKTKFLEYLDSEEKAYKKRLKAYNEAKASRDAIIASNEEITEANKDLPDDQKKALANVPSKSTFPKTKAYLRVRGGKEGIAGNDTHEKEVAGIMRESGQLEDLSDFLHWLNGYSSRSTINLKSGAEKIFGQVQSANGYSKSASVWVSPQLGYKNKLGFQYREKIRLALEKGYAVVLSVSHKGARAFRGHVITVQSIDGTGLIVDDPYGMWNDAYRRTKSKKADAYAPAGSKTRSYDYRNKPAYKDGAATPADYSDADFTVKAGQKMSDNETRGDTSRINFKMINESVGIIGQIYIFKRVL